MAVNFTDLFTRLGKIFGSEDAINTARGTTIPPHIKSITDQFATLSLDLQRAVAPAVNVDQNIKDGCSAGQTNLNTAAQQVLIQMMSDAAPLAQITLTAALEELIAEMVAGPQSVKAAAVNSGTWTGQQSLASGNGDGILVYSLKRPDGLVNENAFAEVIDATCTDDSAPTTAQFGLTSPPAVDDQLSSDWPGGSGLQSGLGATDAIGTQLLGNGGFDTDADLANQPDDWIVGPATVGTTLKMTVYEIQQIVVTGPPTAGTYVINWMNQAGKTQATAILPFDADQGTVQTALRALEGLEQITVSTTGTTPNFTHTITFTGVAGDLHQITITNNTTGGTYTPSTTQAGTSQAFIERAVQFASNGSELTAIYRQVTLKALTQYAFNVWAMVDVVPGAGVLTVDLVDGLVGSVINDQAGNANSFTIAATGLSASSFAAKAGVFRTPRVLPALTYVRIRISTAVSSGKSVFLDHAALVEMAEAYPGGTWLAIFSGKTPFFKGDQQNPADTFALTVTNDRGGKFQEHFQTNFQMREKGLILPSSGSPTISDGLIS